MDKNDRYWQKKLSQSFRQNLEGLEGASLQTEDMQKT